MEELVHMIMILFVVAVVLACVIILTKNKINRMKRNLMSAELNIINAFEAVLPKDIIDAAVEIVACEIESALRS